MAKKQLRTVKKSNETGRLNRDEVRSAVISAREARTGQVVRTSSTPSAPSARSSRDSHSAASRSLAA